MEGFGAWSMCIKCECQKGHEHDWSVDEERLERNVSRVNFLECRYEGCVVRYVSLGAA